MACGVVAGVLLRMEGIIKRGWHGESLKPARSQNNQYDRGEIGIRCYRRGDNVGFVFFLFFFVFLGGECVCVGGGGGGGRVPG